MKVIGITGGVGAGKTSLLSYIKKHYNCRILLADEAAHQVQEPGGACYDSLVALLGRKVLDEEGRIDRGKMAARIFRKEELRLAVNAIVHPAVRRFILEAIEEERCRGRIDIFFLEAALLIECGYQEVVDELWYVYASPEVRRRRLYENRQYAPEKVDAILEAQLSEEEYRKACGIVIDNSREPEYAYKQIDEKLGEYRWQM